MSVRRAIVAVGIVLAAGRMGFADHGHPTTASRFKVWFVRAAAPCVTPTPGLLHTPPLGAPTYEACTPTGTSTLDFGPNGKGSVETVVLKNSLNEASDVEYDVKLTDVRDGGILLNAFLGVTAQVRITDHNCTTPGSCTMIDVPFPVGVPCGTSAPRQRPGRCKAKTSFNAVVPGTVVPGKQVNLGVQQLMVYYGANLVFEAGLFVP